MVSAVGRAHHPSHSSRHCSNIILRRYRFEYVSGCTSAATTREAEDHASLRAEQIGPAACHVLIVRLSWIFPTTDRARALLRSQSKLRPRILTNERRFSIAPVQVIVGVHPPDKKSFIEFLIGRQSPQYCSFHLHARSIKSSHVTSAPSD
jgi:hypothetical protein